ncbi:MAG TPA: lytic murein transglycosylase [Devosia sp.]|nr:lytic murein transglycosylase [Devosia sp.]
MFNSGFRKSLLAMAYCLVSLSTATADPAGSFEQFLAAFESKALASGISRATYRSATTGLTRDNSIAGLISGQPEFTTPIWDYLERRVSSSRIARGRAAFARNKTLFENIGQHYGVDPFVLAAIWGIETDYGAVLGNRGLIKPVIRSLASLAYERRGRVAQDEAEFIAALRLVQDFGYTSQTLVGSWAGAVGHLQVTPSVLVANATDGDGDGKVDPHASLADALATSAVLLNAFGYQNGLDWGYEVQLPQGFDYAIATRNEFKPVSFFATRGVTRVAGRQFVDLETQVFLYLPAGKHGPKFLMTPNYLVLKAYNFSDSYALSVAHLTDRLKGSGPFISDWPRNTKFPNLAQRTAIQQWLKDLGYYRGEVDGRIGPITQEAYQMFQRSIGLPADGFVTLDAYERLQAAVQQ